MLLAFRDRIASINPSFTQFHSLETLQVNLGNMCNLQCSHCHHDASPHGSRIMGREVMDKILSFLKDHPGLTLDITGGCPEMNPDFRYFIEATRGYACRRIIRSNLVIALKSGMEWLLDFYREHELVVMGSLPCYGPENVDKQRGDGVFSCCIEVLRNLNFLGYGRNLELYLVYNPGNSSVFGQREILEQDYRRELFARYGIIFTKLHCMNNTPLGRFRHKLDQEGAYQSYISYLADRFNVQYSEKIMCRNLISIGWNGLLYDCDFNLAAALPIQDSNGSQLTVDRVVEAIIPGRTICMGEHCYTCTAGEGSGCGSIDYCTTN